MEKVTRTEAVYNWDENGKNIPAMFCITDERNSQIEELLRRILKEGMNGDGPFGSKELITRFLDVAENTDELIYCAIQAGRKVEELERHNPLAALLASLR